MHELTAPAYWRPGRLHELTHWRMQQPLGPGTAVGYHNRAGDRHPLRPCWPAFWGPERRTFSWRWVLHFSPPPRPLKPKSPRSRRSERVSSFTSFWTSSSRQRNAHVKTTFQTISFSLNSFFIRTRGSIRQNENPARALARAGSREPSCLGDGR